MVIDSNSPIFLAFESRALDEIREGCGGHLSAKGIVEWIRKHTKVGDGSVSTRINNTNTAELARMFDQLHPKYKGYFKHRQGPFKTETWNRPTVSRDDFGMMDTDTNGQGRFA